MLGLRNADLRKSFVNILLHKLAIALTKAGNVCYIFWELLFGAVILYLQHFYQTIIIYSLFPVIVCFRKPHFNYSIIDHLNAPLV